MIRFWAWIFRWKLVWLVTRAEFCILLRARKDPLGWWVKALDHHDYWLRLMPDGSTKGNPDTIRNYPRWLPYKASEPEQVMTVMSKIQEV